MPLLNGLSLGNWSSIHISVIRFSYPEDISNYITTLFKQHDPSLTFMLQDLKRPPTDLCLRDHLLIMLKMMRAELAIRTVDHLANAPGSNALINPITFPVNIPMLFLWWNGTSCMNCHIQYLYCRASVMHLNSTDVAPIWSTCTLDLCRSCTGNGIQLVQTYRFCIGCPSVWYWWYKDGAVFVLMVPG